MKKKPRKLTVPFDVALLVFFGILIFILFMLTNRVCRDNDKELDIPEISIKIKHHYE